jgi:nucleoid DNA-binding protein
MQMSIKKRDIVDHVAASTGLTKQDVRKVIDHAMSYTRQSLLNGQEVTHPMLGRIKVIRQREDTDDPKTIYRLVLASNDLISLQDEAS